MIQADAREVESTQQQWRRSESRVSSPRIRWPRSTRVSMDGSFSHVDHEEDLLELAESAGIGGISPRKAKAKPEKTQLPAPFPLEAQVVLHGLVKMPNLNGMTGIIRSGLSDGRWRVYVEGTAKTAVIKPDNLKLDDAPLPPTSKMESNNQTEANSPRRKQTKREQARPKRRIDDGDGLPDDTSLSTMSTTPSAIASFTSKDQMTDRRS
jgi:hypothetical protein